MPAILGVLGGMGPLASTAFLETVYRAHAAGAEQAMPRVLLDSDPGFPDRTTVIRRGDPGAERAFAEQLQSRLDLLSAAGAGPLVITCFTAHHFLPFVDPAIGARVVSLVDTALERVAASAGRFLLLATSGTRQARVFERSPVWPEVAHRVVAPLAADQERVHQLVYTLKRGAAVPATAVDELRERYGCSGVVLGCTEFHLISAAIGERCGSVVDALGLVASRVPALLNAADQAAVPTA